MSRWHRLWNAVARWWRNEPLPAPVLPPREYLSTARKLLVEYDDLYGQRTKIGPAYMRAQAAQVALEEGHKRAPGIESEVRVLAITVERILGHLELDIENRNIEQSNRAKL